MAINGKSIYVSSRIGQDTPQNGSSSGKPLATIQAAEAITNPGDTILVMPGEYGNPNTGGAVLRLEKSGRAGAPITYKAFDPNNKPIVRVGGDWVGIVLAGSYTVLDGFEVIGNREQNAKQSVATINNYLAANGGTQAPVSSGYFGDGISIGTYGVDATHITVRNSVVHDLSGGGINAIRSDFATIENNVVYNNANYSPFNTSGISLYQSINANNGQGGTMVIRGNTVYGNRNLINNLNNLDENGKSVGVTDGNGIIVDDHARTQIVKFIDGENADFRSLPAYTGKTIIENNTVYNNGGRGVNIYEASNVEVRNNTLRNNLRTPTFREGEISVITDALGKIKGAGKNIVIGANRITPAAGVPAESVFDLENGRPILKVTGIDGRDRLTATNLSPGQSYKSVEVLGKGGNDILTGSSTTDYNNLFGGDGRDTLIAATASSYNYLVGGRGNDVLNLQQTTGTSDIASYEKGDGSDTLINFSRTGNAIDQIYISNIPAVDVVASSGSNSTALRVGDGIADNAGFGRGELLMSVSGVAGFSPSDVGVSLLGSSYSFS